jgi:hypothetical protein
VSETRRSDVIKVTIAPSNGGSTGPAIQPFTATLTQATRTAPGSILIKGKIGDDAQVRYAFVHQVKPPGSVGDPFLRTVGEMKRASTSNPSEFTCVDEGLPDGTYHYRIVAHDYDGNETISGTTTIGLVVATPAPPPGPITLDIPYKYQAIQPKLPTANTNYKHMPFATSGTVKFNYSGLPTGTTTFLAYRTDLGPDKAYIRKTVTKTSGEFSLPAPTWDVTNFPDEGPGEYKVAAQFAGLPLTVNSGDDTYLVGRSWNQPDSFTKLSYGLYWFKDAYNGLLGISSSQRDEYFDPDRPTVIYVHGWQENEVKVRRRESWLRQDPFNDAKLHDMCKIWRDQGYNVGIFNWNQFGNGGLIESEYNIYGTPINTEFGSAHSMFFSLSPSMGEVARKYRRQGEGRDIEGKSVTELFLGELQRCLGGYMPSEDKEFRMIGHSLGTQLTGRTCDFIRRNPGWGIPRPTRITLLELAQIHGVGFNGIPVSDLQTQYISDLKDAGVAIDCYQSTDLQSLLIINANMVGYIHDMCAYSRWRPDFISPISLKYAPWDVFAKTHNEIIRWYMESFNYEADHWEAWTYRGLNLFAKDQRWGDALSASTSNDDVRFYMYNNTYFEQSEGKNTQNMHDDKWEPKTGP